MQRIAALDQIHIEAAPMAITMPPVNSRTALTRTCMVTGKLRNPVCARQENSANDWRPSILLAVGVFIVSPQADG
jgi:hypothetical protein